MTFKKSNIKFQENNEEKSSSRSNIDKVEAVFTGTFQQNGVPEDPGRRSF